MAIAHSPQSELCNSIVGTIGNTPLVELSRMTSGIDGRVLVKLEYFSPGHSKKDRVALAVVAAAEKSGDLQPGQTVIELTSGNMGTGLAIVCRAKGYPFVAVMSRGNSAERVAMMRAFGAEVVLVDQCPGSVPGEVSGADLERVDREASRLTQELKAFRVDQFYNEANSDAHFKGTAAEIWAQSSGAVNAFCDFAGSGGTFAGAARYFRQQDESIRCYVVEPAGAATLAGSSAQRPDHPIQGGGYAMDKLALMNGIEPDGFIEIDGDLAMETARKLAREEGIFAGYSTGANVAAALELLKGPEAGACFAVVACDSGMKYLSTGLWR